MQWLQERAEIPAQRGPETGQAQSELPVSCSLSRLYLSKRSLNSSSVMSPAQELILMTSMCSPYTKLQSVNIVEVKLHPSVVDPQLPRTILGEPVHVQLDLSALSKGCEATSGIVIPNRRNEPASLMNCHLVTGQTYAVSSLLSVHFLGNHRSG